jgi:glycosyltransferase involved in cell wall biosynthesis
MSDARAMSVAFFTSARMWRGSGVSLAKIANGLRERGHQPHMLAGSRPVRDAFAGLGLPASLVRARSTGLREARELRRRLRSLGTDVILVDKPRDLRLAALATLWGRQAVLYRYNHNALGGPLDLRTRLLVRRAMGCIYQSERVRDRAVGHNPWLARSRAWVIPNGYDVARFAPDAELGATFRRGLGIAPGTSIVLTVSALEKGKGQEVAIEALAQLGKERAVVYLLCGSGDQEGRLRQLASRLRVSALFLGHLDVDQIVAALNAADLVVHPSLEDIFPNAVGEAMSCGRPVVASDVGGVGELVGTDGEAGVLVPAGDPQALSGTIATLLEDADRRGTLGAAARQRIESRFPVSRMLDEYEVLLRASIDRR